MKIGVLSDTHIPVVASELPTAVLKAFDGVDLILHAGDILELSVLDALRAIAPLEAVHGNMDRWETRQALPDKRTITAIDRRIGLAHGGGAPWSLPKRMLSEFPGADIIVFGHSHCALVERRENVLLFNPGSPTDTRFAPFKSYGIIEITDTVKAEIVRLA